VAAIGFATNSFAPPELLRRSLDAPGGSWPAIAKATKVAPIVPESAVLPRSLPPGWKRRGRDGDMHAFDEGRYERWGAGSGPPEAGRER